MMPSYAIAARVIVYYRIIVFKRAVVYNREGSCGTGISLSMFALLTLFPRTMTAGVMSDSVSDDA